MPLFSKEIEALDEEIVIHNWCQIFARSGSCQVTERTRVLSCCIEERRAASLLLVLVRAVPVTIITETEFVSVAIVTVLEEELELCLSACRSTLPCSHI